MKHISIVLISLALNMAPGESKANKIKTVKFKKYDLSNYNLKNLGSCIKRLRVFCSTRYQSVTNVYDNQVDKLLAQILTKDELNHEGLKICKTDVDDYCMSITKNSQKFNPVKASPGPFMEYYSKKYNIQTK